ALPIYPANDGLPSDAEEIDDDGDLYVECDFSAAALAGGAAGNGYGGVDGGSDCLDVTTNTYSDNVNPAPATVEVCDGWDTDCDSQPAYPGNTGAPEDQDELDQDGDTYIQCDMVAGASGNGPNGVQGSDCLDVALVANPYSDDVNPGATETCDSWDTDCSGQPAYPNNDGAPDEAEEADDDADTYVNCDFSAAAIAGGGVNNGYSTVINGSDCLDVALSSNSYSDNVNPAATEVCDSWDTDCANQPAYPNNDGEPSDAEELDDDGDNFVQCTFSGAALDAVNNGYGGVIGDDDCLDVASNTYSDNVNTAAAEVCDGWDTNCSSQPAYPNNDGDADEAEELDDDGDGYIQCDGVAGSAGNGPSGIIDGSDCLDVALTANAYSDNVNPAATETCDSWDTDCGSQPAYPSNTGAPNLAEENDDDGDGYVNCDFSATALAGGAANNGFGGVVSGSDCLDVALTSNAYSDDVSPAATTDVCDGWDTDCDSQGAYPANLGAPEDDDEVDDDGDGYVECTSYVTASGAAGITNGDDCLDEVTGLTFPLDTASNPAITVAMAAEVNPGATEVCDGFNTDCAGGSGSAAYLPPLFGSNESDADFDDYMACGPAESWTPTGLGASDCLDSDVDVNPGEPSDPAGVENLVDNDCDGIFDEDAAAGSIAVTELMVTTTGSDSQWFEIYNASGRAVSLHQWAFDTTSGASFSFTGTSTGPTDAPLQIANDSYEVICVDPSNGTDATSAPAKDCFNSAAMTGFTLSETSDTVTLAVAGSTIDTLSWSSALGSSNNTSVTLDPLITPFITANDTVDTALAGWCEPLVSWNGGTGGRLGSPGYENVSCDSLLIDVDGDGYCAGGQDTTGDGDCNDPSESAGSNDTDCDETNPAINEAATEICDGWDTDCSTGSSFPPDVANEADDDGDNYIECTVSGSPALPGSIVAGDDCDDTRDYMNDGETEVCDGYDNDCAGGASFSDGGGDEADTDSDNYLECSAFTNNDGGGGFLGGSDCDDALDYRFPTNAEVCDGYDNDCSGGVNGTNEVDGDSDQYFLCTGFIDRSGGDSFAGGSDCDDTRSYENPGGTEICDGYDNDCSGGASFTDSGGDELDGDNDDYVECTAFSDSDGGGGFTGGDDCNDAAATTFPGAPELCDALDNNCNGVADDSLDSDGDGVTTCGPDGVQGNTDDDCDDSNPLINPGASEICDGYDSNCTGGGSPLPPDVANELDDDGDGYIECTVSGSPALAPGVTGGSDCDDTLTYRSPGVTEICDGIDNDCNSSADFSDGSGDEDDTDGDSYVDCTPFVNSDGTGGFLGGDDCDDALSYRTPGATEICDGIDNDCNASADFSDGTGDEDDTDADSYVDCTPFTNSDGGGGFEGGNDCDDTLSYRSPGATEICDGIDNDCNASADFSDGSGDEDDTDSDDYVDCTPFVNSDGAFGFLGGDDCDDALSYRTPGATEICDGIDNDCNASADFSDGSGDEDDTDSDDYVDCTPFVNSDGGGGFLGGDDCDDALSYRTPGATEICDGIDNDCNASADFSDGTGDEDDSDSDSYVDCTPFTNSDGGGGFVGGDDCDDTLSYRSPGATEICDGIDNDCNSSADFSDGSGDEDDTDSDSYVDCTPFVNSDGGGGFVGGDDCDDAVGTTFPFAGDSAVDGTDADCDGLDCVAGDGSAGTAYSTGPYYVYCASSGTQAAAVTACEVTVDGSTMRLAEISVLADNTELAALLGTSETAWIGATDTTADGTHVFDAGTENSGGALGFSNFTVAPTADTFVQGVTVDDTGAWAEALVAATPTGYACELP
ncbi:MAG: lamin tail domain-containing protein, partial [Deltaproteobacteria bacterium]|nr:lamin tail domain-containing protein [Deltaproteobacteria bacterium]